MAYQDVLTFVLGYLISIGLGHIVIKRVMNKAWCYFLFHHKDVKRPENILTEPMSILERGLYTTSLILGYPQWIPIWLGLKVAVQWQHWKYSTYNIFLIGSSLSLILGFIGACIAKWQIPPCPI